jgi:DNA-binding NarL/FixJ family response regulator
VPFYGASRAAAALPVMASNPLTAPHVMPQASTAAVVADERFAGHRITAALNAAGLATAELAGSPAELIERGERPDVVVLACDPSAAEGTAAIRKLAAHLRPARIVVVSLVSSGRGVRQALAAGADGLVYESDLESTLEATTRAVLVGHVSVPRELQRCVIKPAFSHREKQVLARVVDGLANQQIARELFLAESTVKSHLASAFQKLGVRSRKEAAALLTDPEEGLGQTVLGADLRPAERQR